MTIISIERVADGSAVLAPARRALKLPPGWGVQDHPLDVLSSVAGGAGEVTGYLELVPPAPGLGSQSPPQLQESAGTSVVTVDGTTAVLWSYKLPTGKVTGVTLELVAYIATAAHRVGHFVRSSIVAWRNPGGAFDSTVPVYTVLGSAAPFSSSVGNPGFAEYDFDGTSVNLTATGIDAPAAWSAGNYTKGALVTRGGNVYIVVDKSGSGTSTTGPSGTGTGIVDNAGANQVIWDWLAAGVEVPITWCVCKASVFTP